MVPLQIKDPNLTIDRPGFMLNPTSCNPMSITGTITANIRSLKVDLALVL
jgi:hypothetical protein